MIDSAFQAYLSPRLGARSIASYLAHARTAERKLAINLDTYDLGDTGILSIATMLSKSSMPPATVANTMTAIRAYAAFKHGGSAASPIIALTPAVETLVPADNADPLDLSTLDVATLLRLHGRIGDNLRDRGIVRTANGIVGDYAELLFSRAFGWLLEANSASGHDATDADGTRYQIKARRIGPRNPSRQLSAIRRLPDHTFDFLAAVLFDADLRVSRGIVLPYNRVVARAKRAEHTNSWRLMLQDVVWSESDAQDVTAELIAAQNSL